MKTRCRSGVGLLSCMSVHTGTFPAMSRISNLIDDVRPALKNTPDTFIPKTENGFLEKYHE